jgi:glucose-6-phosphate isomerase
MEKYNYLELPSFQKLLKQRSLLQATHLKDQLKDDKRTHAFQIAYKGIFFDFTRQNFNLETIPIFEELAKDTNLFQRIERLFKGEVANHSEKRAALHMALRAHADDKYEVDGKDVMKDIHNTLNCIRTFSQKVRNGEFKGCTGKQINTFVSIGIGGSYLSIEFIYEALRYYAKCYDASKGFIIKFLPNVDPVDFFRVTNDINPETTLFLINSKTFTTAETILNAETCKQWAINKLKTESLTADNIVSHHFCAVTSNVKAATSFGIDKDNLFDFGAWVGGRLSVWGPIGMLPLSLCFSYEIMKEFLEGGRDIDEHFRSTKQVSKNIPMMMAMIGFYNVAIQQYYSRAVVPYAQALHKFVPHLQELIMESNGKNVTQDGKPVTGIVCPTIFGDAGTNSQHCFFQSIQQGMVTPCEFIGYVNSLREIDIKSSSFIRSHDELMANFFAQPDALALGSNDPCPYKKHDGNRPSLSILFDELTPYSLGQLLSIYEFRTIVEAFIYNINPFDAMGVDLGKTIAKDIKEGIKNAENLKKHNKSTALLIERYISKRKKLE